MRQSKENTKLSDDDQKQGNITNNIVNILLYALSLATALGFNDLILTIFDSFNFKTYILAKTIYVIIMLSATVVVAYQLNFTINK